MLFTVQKFGTRVKKIRSSTFFAPSYPPSRGEQISSKIRPKFRRPLNNYPVLCYASQKSSPEYALKRIVFQRMTPPPLLCIRNPRSTLPVAVNPPLKESQQLRAHENPSIFFFFFVIRGGGSREEEGGSIFDEFPRGETDRRFRRKCETTTRLNNYNNTIIIIILIQTRPKNHFRP